MADLRSMIVEGHDPAAVVEFIRTNPTDASREHEGLTMVQIAFQHEAPRAVLDALLDANGALVGPARDHSPYKNLALWHNDLVYGRLAYLLYTAHYHIFDKVCVPLRAFVDHCVDQRWFQLLLRPSTHYNLGEMIVARLRTTLRTDEDVAFLLSMNNKWHLSYEINAVMFIDCVRLYMDPPHEISLGCLSSILDHDMTIPMLKNYRHALRPGETLLSFVLSQVPDPSSDRFADLVRMIAQHRKIVFESIDENCLFLLVTRYEEFRDKQVLVRLFNFMIDCGANVREASFRRWLDHYAHFNVVNELNLYSRGSSGNAFDAPEVHVPTWCIILRALHEGVPKSLSAVVRMVDELNPYFPDRDQRYIMYIEDNEVTPEAYALRARHDAEHPIRELPNYAYIRMIQAFGNPHERANDIAVAFLRMEQEMLKRGTPVMRHIFPPSSVAHRWRLLQSPDKRDMRAIFMSHLLRANHSIMFDQSRFVPEDL